ncbi:MAG TPA: hypothetical protein VLL52_14560, partial [Anaerolineae bacterium]|nr:hypothetical protein [Anaerolineae bacterium]
MAGVFNLERHDGELEADLALRAEVARLYRLTGADTVLTFDPDWAGQIHPDHRAAGRVAVDAYMPSKMPLYRPEQLVEGVGLGKVERILAFMTGEPDVVVEVTGVYEQKMAACRAHVSQFPEGDKSLEWMKRLDEERGKKVGVRYAEMFKQIGVW